MLIVCRQAHAIITQTGRAYLYYGRSWIIRSFMVSTNTIGSLVYSPIARNHTIVRKIQLRQLVCLRSCNYCIFMAWGEKYSVSQGTDNNIIVVYDDDDEQPAMPVIHVESSRGCLYCCLYCLNVTRGIQVHNISYTFLDMTSFRKVCWWLEVPQE